MSINGNPTRFAEKIALVTGANSGLGYEAAAQLAEAGYGKVILACRTVEKAEGARRTLAERVGEDPFDTLAIDVADLASANTAATELIGRGQQLDALLLNAGLVSGDELQKSVDGLEMSFAASIVGHHVLTERLLEADLLSPGARIVIAGSEAANGDLPAMFGMSLFDFADGEPETFGTDLQEAMLTFARVEKPEQFDGGRYYATTKVFTAWWTAALARRHGDRISVFTVSPGSNMGTNAARHTTGFKRFLFTKVMPTLGPLLGIDQPVPVGAKRYVDVLAEVGGPYLSGKTYTSAPKKMTGPLQEMVHPHLVDTERQEAAWAVIGELTGTARAASGKAAVA